MDSTQPATQPQPHDAHAHGEPDFGLYIRIFVALAVLTAVSFFTYELLEVRMHMRLLSTLIIMLVSVVKAVLVAMFFMHLKWDWSKLYFLVIPVCIMGVMMMIVLLPDIVLAWWQ